MTISEHRKLFDASVGLVKKLNNMTIDNKNKRNGNSPKSVFNYE